MRYLCVHCDEKFELESDADVRCPKCLRVHGIRPLASEAPGAAPGGSKRRAPLLALGLVAIAVAGGLGYRAWQRELNPDAETLASKPLRERTLRHELERAAIDAGELAQLLASNAAIERAASRAAAGQAGNEQKARAVVKALRARAASGAFVTWSRTDPRGGPVLTAAQTLAAIDKDNARKQLYPLELAALGVAELRALDVPAMMVEVYAWPNERAPIDPSGRSGYFGIGLPGAAGKTLRVFDAYGGRGELANCTADCALLGDLQAVGAALSLRGSERLAKNEEPGVALRDADAAVKLLPGSPSVRSSRGAILLANAASELGQNEFEAAAQMRPDGPRQNNVAMVHLALGDGERAAREIAHVLEQQPDFALAHTTLAQIHLARGERELARAELEKAEALDSALPSLALAQAQFYAATGDNERALSYALKAVQARPNDPQAHLVLGRIYRMASRYDEMRQEAQRVLQLVPPSLTERIRTVIESILGPTALESGPAPAQPSEPAAQAGAPTPTAAIPAPTDAPKLRLSDTPSAAPSDGTLNPSGEPKRLRLSDPGQGLKLRSP